MSAAGTISRLQSLAGTPLPTVELVRERLGELDVDHSTLRHLDERRALRAARGRAPEGTGPLQGALGGGDPDVEVAVVGLGVVESADAAGDGADVAEQDAGCRAVEPFPPVDADLRRHRLVPHVAQPGQHVREPPGPVLQPAIGVIDHLGVESGPGHDSEVFAVQLAEVEPPARTVERYPHGLRQVGRDTEVAGEHGSRCRPG